jgi:hypothetical protein
MSGMRLQAGANHEFPIERKAIKRLHDAEEAFSFGVELL